MNGYIKLYRALLDWEWYDDVNTKTVFLHLLLTANWKPAKWHGVDVGAGQRIISIQGLADETGLTFQQIRTVLNRLESTGEITRRTTKKYTLVTIENYEKYQGVDEQSNKDDNKNANSQLTNSQQTVNKQPTNNQQQIKKDKKDKKDEKDKNYYFYPTDNNDDDRLRAWRAERGLPERGVSHV